VCAEPAASDDCAAGDDHHCSPGDHHNSASGYDDDCAASDDDDCAACDDDFATAATFGRLPVPVRSCGHTGRSLSNV
jgi:hypothetical protein